jgi:hypothetical protein
MIDFFLFLATCCCHTDLAVKIDIADPRLKRDRIALADIETTLGLATGLDLFAFNISLDIFG